MPPQNPRSSRSPSRVAWALLAPGLTLLACSSSDTTPAPPAGPPIFQISLIPAGGTATAEPEDSGAAPACVELGHDSKETITLRAEDPKNPGTIANWTFQPPFNCGDTVQCGYLLVTVDPGPHALVVASASVSVDLPMAELQHPVGSHTIIVELWNSNRTPALDGEGNKIRRRVTIVTCSPLADGGSRTDAGLDGSSPSGLDGAAPDGSRDSGAGSAVDGALESGTASDAAPLDSGARATDATLPSADAAALDAAPLDAGRRD